MKNKLQINNNPLSFFGKHAGKMVCLIALFFSTSCKKYLDVQPEGQLIESQLLVDAGGFEAALYGIYGTMNSRPLYGEQLSHNALDVMAQYFTCIGNNNTVNLLQYNYAFSGVEDILEEIWKKSYSNIAYANNVIKNLERFTPENLEHFNLYKGEALGLRAFMHFDLLRLFGDNIQLQQDATGIPYLTSFGLKEPDFVSLAAVYENVIADLILAEQLLSSDAQNISYPKTSASYPFLKDREIHFNLYAVQATLARVYLTKGDLPNAALYAEKVINSGKFELLEKAEIGNGIFKGVLFPKECIFGLYSNNHFITSRDRFLLQTSFYAYDNRSNISALYNNVQGGHDYRWDGFFKLPANQNERLRLTKLVDPYQVNDQEYLRPAERIKGINMIRLPEMYYIAAEALLPTNPDKAMDYFDQVLKSRGLIALKDRVPSVQLTLQMITEDRYKEFIGEGQSFYNMKRLNLNINNTAMQVVPASKSIYVPPIPKIEFDYRN